MINLTQAKNIAADYLSNLEINLKQPLQTVKVIEKSFGWIFFYQSAEYVETNDFRKMLAGNAPFVVDIDDGRVEIFGTAYPVETYIEQYEAGRIGK